MTWLLSLPSKIKLYAVLAAALLVTIAIAVVKLKASGAQSEKLKTLQSTLTRKRIEYDVAATNAAVDASVRRKRLHDRWERK